MDENANARESRYRQSPKGRKTRSLWLTERKQQLCEYATKARRKLRANALRIYGDKCACCGEQEPVFLTIDHVHNDGALRRKGGERNYQILILIRDSGRPLPQFQVLCFNCNAGKQWNGGVCPHYTQADQSAS